MLRLVWLVSAVVLAFGVSSAAAQGPVEEVDPSIMDGSAQRALDDARVRWEAAGLSSYRFMVDTSCFGCWSGPEPMTVRDGEPQGRGGLASVPQLFEHIQEAIDGRYRTLDVSYGEHGVPREIHTEIGRLVQDDSFGVTVSHFRRLVVDRSIRNGSARRALAAARRAWRALGLRSYSFQLKPPVCRVLACPVRGWSTHVVRDGRPRSRPVGEWATIPRLFATISRAIEDEVESLDVRYDGNGVPRSIAIREIDVGDAEIALALRRLRSLGGDACAAVRARAVC
jgi:hypothetical protein